MECPKVTPDQRKLLLQTAEETEYTGDDLQGDGMGATKPISQHQMPSNN